MSKVKLMRLKVDGKSLVFKHGNPPVTDPSHIEAWTCPHCLKPTRKATCIVSQIQFGLEWDVHVDYFRCKCGQLYYAPYKVWLVEGEQ